jgi:hypothetical protein
MPSGSVIYWDNHAPGTGAKIGTFPPANVVEEIRKYAAKRHIRLEVVDSNPFSSQWMIGLAREVRTLQAWDLRHDDNF